MTNQPISREDVAREVLAEHLTDAPHMDRELYRRAVAAMLAFVDRLAAKTDAGEASEREALSTDDAARLRARKAITDRYYAGGKVVQMTPVKPAELVDIVIAALKGPTHG
jgi:hypothetical protein